MECFGDKEESQTEGRTNCGIGKNCGNRTMQEPANVSTKPLRFKNRGWGLIPLQDLKEGQFVIEYNGEVLTERAREKRMNEYQAQHPEDRNMYVMDIGFNMYIDARYKNNKSRFINHSCKPNCHLEKWIIKGKQCMGIFATQDIPQGTELTYDYQFNTESAADFECHCGADNCRGTLAWLRTEKKQVDIEDMTIKEKIQKLRTFEKQELLAISKLSLTSNMLPGTNTNIRNGCHYKDIYRMRNAKMALKRNLDSGIDFAKRVRIWRKNQIARKKANIA